MKLVTCAYFNIQDYPYYGSGRRQRILEAFPWMAKNLNVPIICYTSKKLGCYDLIKQALEEKNVTNVEFKIFELEQSDMAEPISRIMRNALKKGKMELTFDTDLYIESIFFRRTPILVYWLKAFFLLQEAKNYKDYVYWIDAAMSHSGMFPSKYSSGNLDKYGYTGMDAEATYSYPQCFSPKSMEYINTFTSDKILNMGRYQCDAPPNKLFNIPELQKRLADSLDTSKKIIPVGMGVEYADRVLGFPVAAIFGGNPDKCKLIDYLNDTLEVYKTCISHNFLIVEEAVMAYMHYLYRDEIKLYMFENFYRDGDGVGLHEKNTEELKDPNIPEVYHHFYRFFCDNKPLIGHDGIS